MITLATYEIYNENGTIGYPIHYCPICGEKLK